MRWGRWLCNGCGRRVWFAKSHRASCLDWKRYVLTEVSSAMRPEILIESLVEREDEREPCPTGG